MKRETKSLIVAAQNQSIKTKLISAKIGKSQKDKQSLDHVVSACSKFVQKEYKKGMTT